MNDQQCIDFLQWCLPSLGYRWRGFRKVRKQVCKRIVRRLLQLKLSNMAAYKEYLETHETEWRVLDSFCYITISRFYRDKRVSDTIQSKVFQELAQNAIAANQKELRVWSAGCCAGEEAYTLQILWLLSIVPALKKPLPLKIIATDRDALVLERAHKAVYSYGSIKDLPKDIVPAAFDKVGDEFRLKERFKENVEFHKQNILLQMPDGPFDLLLCRNLVFTYFSEEKQREFIQNSCERLKPGGFLIIGHSEALPGQPKQLIALEKSRGIFRKLC